MRIDRYTYSIGDSLAEFTVKAQAGRGGSGETYIVSDDTGQCFAVKVCQDDQGTEKKGIIGVRNIEETPGLLRIYQAGALAGKNSFAYVMQAADNVLDWPQYEPDSLARRIALLEQPKAAEIFSLMTELLQGIEAIHKAGYVHRDIKPENILFVKGRPCLADFGLLCPVNQNLPVAGTPGYIPPEYLGKSTQLTSFGQDFYALGKIIYVLWSGKDAAEYPSLPSLMDLREFTSVHYCYERACAEKLSLRPKNIADFRELLAKAGKFNHSSPPRRIYTALFLALATAILLMLGWWLLHGKNIQALPEQSQVHYDSIFDEPLFSTAQENEIFQKCIDTDQNPLIEEFFDVHQALSALPPPWESRQSNAQRKLLERRKQEIEDDKRFQVHVLNNDLSRHRRRNNQEAYRNVLQQIRSLIKELQQAP